METISESGCRLRPRLLARCMYVGGGILTTAGVLISLIAFKSCQQDPQNVCSPVLKILGPVIAALGMGILFLARCRAAGQNTTAEPEGATAVEPIPPVDQAYSITVDNETISLPAPPPSYFEMPAGGYPGVRDMRDVMDPPPSYESLYSRRYVSRTPRIPIVPTYARDLDRPPKYEDVCPV